MKEYINRLARGNFIYELPQLKFSVSVIEDKVVVDTQTVKQLEIFGSDQIRGLVYSSNERVIVRTVQFCGVNNAIEYEVNTSGCMSGEFIDGKFHVISNAGEAEIAFHFITEEQVCETSDGNTGNLYEFATLLEHSPKEAASLFLTDTFQQVFLKDDIVLCNIYNLLKKEPDTYLAMEEFLIAGKKKEPVTISLNVKEREYSGLCENQKDVIVIERSGWGYLNLKLCSDNPFIRLSKLSLTQDDFTGNRYELEYVVEREQLHTGNNYGRITVSSLQQELSVEVKASAGGMLQMHYERNKALFELTKEYLNYRMKTIDLLQWIENSNQILNRIRGIEQDDVYFKLVQAQMFFMQRQVDDGQWLLDSVKDQVLTDIDHHVELYCYYLYVNSLAMRSEEYTAQAVAIITKYYDHGYDNFRILWLLFYLDTNQYSNKSIKLARMKDIFRDGCTSPIMYMEALSIMNTQPVLLRVLNEFEYQVVVFGCKYKAISKELALQVCQLIRNEKVANVRYLDILHVLYEMYDEDEILAVLVSHLIRNEFIGEEFLPLYEKGILRGLRITRLYEYYMMSLDHHKMDRLPKMVLMYFVYESELEFHTKAYLYANIISNKEQMPDIMNKYAMQIEQFGFEQIHLGHIDPNLEIIYRYIWNPQMVNEDTAEFLCRYLFTYRVTCFDDNISRVFVKHKELLNAEVYPIINKVAYVPIYTEGAAVCFEYHDGSLRNGTVQYEIERLFEDQESLEVLKQYRIHDLLLGLNFYETSNKSGQKDEITAKNCLDIMKNPEVTRWVKYDMNSWLIDYYYRYYTGDQFEDRFTLLNHETLRNEDAAKLIEVCIMNGLFEDAYDLVKKYGYMSIRSERLFHLVKHMIEIAAYRKDPILIAMSGYVFEQGKYDKDILQYLNEFYNGTNEQMYDVWKAACNYEVDSYEIAERLIAQMLFTGEHNGRLTEVFRSYYQTSGNQRLIEGYTAYQSFQYFIKHKTANEIVFEVLEKTLLKDDQQPDVCKLALLKHYAECHEPLKEEQLQLAGRILTDMCKQNRMFSFYHKFRQLVDLPYNAIDKTVVEYYATPNSKVMIHYQLSSEKDSHTEILKCIAGGAYTKAFTLFYGDTLQYYFTVESNGTKTESEHNSITSNWIQNDNNDGRFDYLNDMLASREQHDIASLKKIMHEYCVNNYLAEQIFKKM